MQAGMNPKTLQYLMGHSDISVTLNTYTHRAWKTLRRSFGAWKRQKPPAGSRKNSRAKPRLHRNCLK